VFGDSSIPPNSSLGAPTSTGLVINDQICDEGLGGHGVRADHLQRARSDAR
jgi:hypothetical protein